MPQPLYLHLKEAPQAGQFASMTGAMAFLEQDTEDNSIALSELLKEDEGYDGVGPKPDESGYVPLKE